MAEAAAAEQLAALREVALRAGVHTLLLRAPATLGWLTGARWHVPYTLDSACFDVVVEQADTTPVLRVVTNAIEAPRLRDTELAHLDTEWTVQPWTEPRAQAWPSGSGVGSDVAHPGTVDVSTAVAQARLLLTPQHRAALAALAADCAEVAGVACAAAEPASSERHVAATLAAGLLARGADPVCLFVAGGQRMAVHRHPLPTGAPLGGRAMVVACGRRDGVVASVTRIVSFSPVPSVERARYTALLAVEQAFLDASRPGSTLGAAFRAGTAAYAEHGFDPQEWTYHHQGGLTGFVPRAILGHPQETTVLREHMATAWNPSGDGWKVEDTCLLTPDGVQPLVTDTTWPSRLVGGRLRPDVWEK